VAGDEFETSTLSDRDVVHPIERLAGLRFGGGQGCIQARRKAAQAQVLGLGPEPAQPMGIPPAQ